MMVQFSLHIGLHSPHMIFKILITVLALAPNALIGYVYFNRDAIIQQ